MPDIRSDWIKARLTWQLFAYTCQMNDRSSGAMRARGAAGHRVDADVRTASSVATPGVDAPGAQIVLSAAVDAIAEHGYHGTSVRDIAVRAGMSSAALYHHFPSKQDLLFTIMERGIDILVEASEKACAEAGNDPVARLRALVRVLVLTHSQHRKEAFIGSSEARSLAPANRAIFTAKRNYQQRLMDNVVLYGTDRGLFRPRDPQAASRAIVTMCITVATWFNESGPSSPEEIADSYADIALDLLNYTAST